MNILAITAIVGFVLLVLYVVFGTRAVLRINETKQLALHLLERVPQASSREIRQALRRAHCDYGAPLFYAAMAQLEDENKVEGWYVPYHIDDQNLLNRMYRKV